VVACGANVSIAYHDFTASGGQVQNGAPDGIALLGPGAAVIQFLSYEGTFTATDGPANGLLSQDIGQLETNGTAPGTSLQLSGASGTSYADFAWQPSASANFGGCNLNQSFGAAVDEPPTVVSSVPGDGGTLPANQPLSVTFSVRRVPPPELVVSVRQGDLCVLGEPGTKRPRVRERPEHLGSRGGGVRTDREATMGHDAAPCVAALVFD